MKIHESGENYLETILMLENRLGEVRSIDIANELGFSKPSVSVAVKNFKQNGFVHVDGAGHITLSPDGRAIAEKVLERHTVLSKVLIHLGVCEEVAKTDACRVEHDLSEESFQQIKSFFQKNMKKKI